MLERSLPTVERLHRRAGWSAVPPGPGNSSLENRPPVNRHSVDHFEGDVDQRNLQSTTPGCVDLPRVRADVDVDESLAWWTLHDWTSEIRRRVPVANGYRNAEFEVQVLAVGSLLLDGFVAGASANLQAEVHARWWFLQHNSKRQYTFHGSSSALATDRHLVIE